MDLLQRREWAVQGAFPVGMALEAGFAQEVSRRFERAASLVALLNEPLTLRPKSSSFAPLPLRS